MLLLLRTTTSAIFVDALAELSPSFSSFLEGTNHSLSYLLPVKSGGALFGDKHGITSAVGQK